MMIGAQGPDSGAIYHIRIKGSLDAKWADWFDGFVMTSRDGDETLLAGRVEDQAALHGVLTRIRSLGLPLLFLLQAECPCRKANCPRHGLCADCYENHAAKGRLPYCFRERTRWDKQCTALLPLGKRHMALGVPEDDWGKEWYRSTETPADDAANA